MNAAASSCRRMLLYLPLALLFFLAGCTGTPSEAASSIHEALPAHPRMYTLQLPAQQKLRDISGDFSASKRGADTGILVLPGEKVEILASGSASIQPDKQPSGPAGISSCQTSALPEPSLPCDSVIYSVGITGRAGEVGTHIGFNPGIMGNLFLGVNAFNVASDAGSFLITVVIVPSKTIAGVWATPANGFTVQGTTMHLSAYIFAQNATIEDVEFMAATAGQAPVSICQALNSGIDTYSCQWNLTLHGDYLHNGQFTLGFTVNGSTMSGDVLAPTVNPDGTRTGDVRYVFPQPNTYYAGYAATAFDHSQQMIYQKITGQWTVPRAHCAPGETSFSAVWVGITSDSTDKSLLAQLGTDSDCQSGTPRYSLWWETFPAPSVPLDLPLRAGDHVTAAVAFQHNIFSLSIDVPGEHDHFSTTHQGQASDTSIAECIVEAPTINGDPTTNSGHIAQLTDFGTVSVSCQLNQGKPIADGPQNILYQMQTDTGDAKATTSPLNPAGSTFTVQWHHG